MTLVVHDAIRFPNPLVVRKHEIALAPKPGAIEVRETLTIDNPAAGCYVGHSAGDDAEPVTLTLAIPSDFERIIFDAEFFGRRFAVRDGKLVTSVPWTPGRKELGFTYTLPNRDGQRVWQRPLDLPSEQVSVRVRAAEIAAVTCTLGSRRLRADDEVQFASSGSTLPTGHVLRVEFGRGTLPLTGYARWLALVGLAAAIGGIYVVRRRRASRDAQTISAPAKSARRLRRTA
jgi:LPXTG-motif cell wall-anchored protein